MTCDMHNKPIIILNHAALANVPHVFMSITYVTHAHITNDLSHMEYLYISCVEIQMSIIYYYIAHELHVNSYSRCVAQPVM